MALLEIQNLSVEYQQSGKKIAAVKNVSLKIGAGEIFGLAGESGCGKTTLALAIGKLLPKPPAATITSGAIVLNSVDLLGLNESEIRRLRGGDIGYVFQDPLSSLNPVLTAGEQIEETTELHLGTRSKALSLEILDKVKLKPPERIYDSYPHQLSGGERQRVMIAMAIVAKPKLLIADEPTTALDVTIQAGILDLLVGLRDEMNMALLLVTHNLNIIKKVSERLAVMYAGEIVELGQTREVFNSPRHPYTEALINSMPAMSLKKGNGETKRLSAIKGQPPNLAAIPEGCPFHPRCHKYLGDICRNVPPRLTEKDNRYVSCHIYTKEVAG